MLEDKKVIIVTHSSRFHADDVFAVASLHLLLENEYKITVMRSRDVEVIEKGDYVVDVGGIYDPEKNRFDHHQTGGAGVRPNTIPYASFGLVWKNFGEKICGSTEIRDRIERILVQQIDASDNGLVFMEPKIPGVYPYEIHDFLTSLFPSMKEGIAHVDKAFMEAVSYAKVVLIREIIRSKDIVEVLTTLERIYSQTNDKRLMVFETYYPTSDFVSKFPELLFIIYPVATDNTWAIKAVQDIPSVSRKLLPETWASKSNEALEEATGVPGAVFCHNKRFMAVAKTKEAILKMAEIALNS